MQEEYAVAGTADAYSTKGAYPEDGKIALTPTTSAPYKTRIVVRRPKDPADFSGTVVVEWLNVSGGLDASPDWTYAADELVRNGDAWVGVSAQQIGVEGGPVAVMTPVSEAGGAGKGIKAQDPARYSTLHHPGDAYSYDIYTQVARALRSPGERRPARRLRRPTTSSRWASRSRPSRSPPTTTGCSRSRTSSTASSSTAAEARRFRSAPRTRAPTSRAASAAHRSSSAPTAACPCSPSRPRPTCSVCWATSRHANPTPT